MGFDTRAFLAAQMVARTAQVQIEEARAFFDEGEEPVWEVRGLSGEELSRIYELAQRQTKLANLAAALAQAGADEEKLKEIRAALGLYEGLSIDIKKRLEMFVIASVEPQATLAVARKLFDAYPVDFYALTTKILELTGLGAVPDEGKS